MIVSIALGLLAAVVATAPQLVSRLLTGFNFQSPFFILGVTLFSILLIWFLREKKQGSKTYCGFSDIMIHIHSASTPDSPARWTIHGLISFLFSVFGGVVGIEGAASELAHSAAMRLKQRSARWYEQRRRSDAATALAAGVAAAFHAPFAAILLPLEMGMGGRALSSLLAALSAYLAVEFMAVHFNTLDAFNLHGALDGFHFSGWQSWASPLVLGIVVGIFSVVLIRLIRHAEEALIHFFPRSQWLRALTAGVVLAAAAYIYKPAHVPSWMLVQDIFWSNHSLLESTYLLTALTLSLVMVLAGFGSLGILSPLFAIGGVIGFGFNEWIWSAMPGFSVASGLTGVAAIWAAVLGAPLSGCVLIFELSHDQEVLIPCLIAAFVARETRRLLLTPAIHQLELEGRGLRLIEGRSAAVLDTLFVRQAMVSDHELVHEHEAIPEIHQRLEKSKYAFFPVVNLQGKYLGLLTADMIQDAWDTQKPDKFVSNLVVAKDLLYRSGLKVPAIGADDSLTATAGIFDNFPCVPAISEEGRVEGLLFVHSVRLAYDREVARRSLSVSPALRPDL